LPAAGLGFDEDDGSVAVTRTLELRFERGQLVIAPDERGFGEAPAAVAHTDHDRRFDLTAVERSRDLVEVGEDAGRRLVPVAWIFREQTLDEFVDGPRNVHAE